VTELFEIAEQKNIEIFVGNIPLTGAMSVPGYIALDYRMVGTHSEERSNTAHEMGHCVKNAFYEKDAPRYEKQRCENKADKWAIETLIKQSDLDDAVKLGYTDVWELSDYFCVTYEFMYKALWWYKYGNLAVEWPQT